MNQSNENEYIDWLKSIDLRRMNTHIMSSANSQPEFIVFFLWHRSGISDLKTNVKVSEFE